MPVCLESNHAGHDQKTATKWLFGRSPADFREGSSHCVRIGLINNMPDGALKATEHQFLSLLDSASGDILVRVSLYALPTVPRSELAARHIRNMYSKFESFWDQQLDGLIVTGREPLAASLKDETYWETFTKVLEWAEDNTYSTVWSCLAAHAAILHMDGIGRIRSDKKHFGIFDCSRVSDHLLMAGTPSSIRLPHSRWNGVSEDELTASGYKVLTRTDSAGVDIFVRQRKSLFLFFQGHPEYESKTLLLEYRRDVGRYLRDEVKTYPHLPQNYFDEITSEALKSIQERATSCRTEELLSEVTSALEKRHIENTWHPTAECIYKNWLEYICAQKNLSRA